MVARCAYAGARAAALDYITHLRNGVNWYAQSRMLRDLTGERWLCWELGTPTAFSDFKMPKFAGDFILGVTTDYVAGRGYRHSIYATRTGIYEPRRGRWYALGHARWIADFREWYAMRVVARAAQFERLDAAFAARIAAVCDEVNADSEGDSTFENLEYTGNIAGRSK